MIFNIDDFKEYCLKRDWIIDFYTSEFTLQFRLCRFLEQQNLYDIELESNIERYGYKGFVKKEIDIDLLSKEGIRSAIELKFIRDKGSFNIGMFNECEDIKFIEQLVENNFDCGYSIIFTNIDKLYTPKTKLKPKNQENIDLYQRFRNERKIYGEVALRTDSFNKKLTLKGKYNINWHDFTDGIKVAVFKVSS